MLAQSYNSIDGIPVAADKWLLTDTLRTEWGFDGQAQNANHVHHDHVHHEQPLLSYDCVN